MNDELKNLWADFGELSAQQEILTSQIQQVVNRKRQIYSDIIKLKQEEINSKKKKENNGGE